MDAEFSDDQEALRTSVRRFVDDHADLRTSRGWFDRSEPALPDAAWQGLADLGLVGMLVPTVDGGSGGDLRDLGVAIEELGRAVVPGPFISTAVAGARALALLGTDAQRIRWLEPLAAGSLTTALVVDADVTVDASGGTPRLGGGARHVLDGDGVDLLLVVARRNDGGHDVLAVEAGTAGVSAEPVDGIDPSRRIAHLTFADAVAEQLEPTDDALARILDEVAVALVLDALGSAEASLALAVAYAHERRQFGAAIGTFQAVQHLCADMLRDLETVRGAAYHAAWALDVADRGTAHHAATVARAIAAEALSRVGAACIQVHGGIGFTWEHDAHRFYKRQLSMAALVAAGGDPLDELADLVLPA